MKRLLLILVVVALVMGVMAAPVAADPPFDRANPPTFRVVIGCDAPEAGGGAGVALTGPAGWVQNEAHKVFKEILAEFCLPGTKYVEVIKLPS